MSTAIAEPTTTPTTATLATVDAKAFAGLLTDVLLFASKEEHLPALCAVQLQPGVVDGKRVIVARATDRYGLAEGWVEVDGEWSDTTVLVPVAGVRQILAVLKAAGKYGLATVAVAAGAEFHNATITVSDFSTQATVYCSDGCFPKVASLWPSGDDNDAYPAQLFARDSLIRPATVAKRRGDLVRVYSFRQNVLVTVGADFRALIMKSRDSESVPGYSEPTYS
jgi:DNA polymerase III sliding clamp (beta) subunit (PCNA family)